MDNQSPKQMMGQMFDGAAFHSNVELINRYAPTQSEHTPYLGMMLDESMIQEIEACLNQRLDTAIKGIKDHITPHHEKAYGAIIPVAWNASSFEPVYDYDKPLSLRVLGAVKNYTGLQILMLEVNGKSTRKDKIPYHMIWSVDEAPSAMLYQDDGYTWPVMEHIKDIPVLDEQGRLMAHFNDKQIIQTHRRVLSGLEIAAEQLAMTAHETVKKGYNVWGNVFDYLACAIDLKFPLSYYAPLRRVEYNGGHRIACHVGW